MARALADTGVSTGVSLDPFYGPAQGRAEQEIRDLLLDGRSRFFVGGFPTAGDLEQFATINKLLSLGGPNTALTTMIERDRIGPQSVAVANKAKQWWLPNQANIDAFLRSGVQASRLRKVHVPFFPNDPHLPLAGRRRVEGPTHFYRIGVVDQRKDQAKTLLAFLRAFKPGEAKLTFKTTNMAYELRGLWLDDPQVRENGWDPVDIERDIQIVHALWEESQMVDLHRRGDVYLSLSHGEGWDMPAFDALLAGNRIVFTESGGPQEFASEGDLLVPTSAMMRCDPRYKWEPDAMWVDYNVDDAVKALREAHERPLPKTHRRSWSGFTSADVGTLMRSLLLEMSDSTRSRAKVPTPKKHSIAVVSLFRQCPETVASYRKRLEVLSWPVRPHIVTVEGDSTDSTPELLDAWARENDHVHSLHLSLGNPLFGSTLHPLRLLTLATVSNHGLDYVAKNLEVEYVFFLTADLMYEPDLAERLRAALDGSPRAGLVAPMVWRHNGITEIFYDTWAFRRGDSRDPLFEGTRREELLRQLGSSPVKMRSVGSVLFCRSAPIYAGVRFTPEMDVVGFSTQMREAGYSIWADPKSHTQHPRQVHVQEIRAPGTRDLARTLLSKWTGEASDPDTQELLTTYTQRELQQANITGPVEVGEAVRAGKTELLLVYRPNSVPHGVASHTMFLRDAHPRASWVTSIGSAHEIANKSSVKTVVIQVQWGCHPTREEWSAADIRIVQELRRQGVRIVVNYHHAENSPEWLRTCRVFVQHSDLVVFHHPSGVEFAGSGVYYPLPIPDLKVSNPSDQQHGLVFTGFADPSRCIDKLVGVAERLGEPIYGYGPRLKQISRWYDTRSWKQFRPQRSYLNEYEGAAEVAKHSVGLFARIATSRAYSSASARFCIACSIPVVIDSSKSYEDLRDVATVVDYDDHRAADESVKSLLRDPSARGRALQKQLEYAQRHSVQSLLAKMVDK